MKIANVLSTVLFTVVLAVPVLHAATGRPVDIPERVKGAKRAVVGKVVQVEAGYATNKFGDQLIVSRAKVHVEEVLKGGAVTDVDVDVEGGTVGEITLDVSDFPKMQVGDRAVFFLAPGPRGADVPHLRGQGILKLDTRNVVERSSLTLDKIREIARQVREQ